MKKGRSSRKPPAEVQSSESQKSFGSIFNQFLGNLDSLVTRAQQFSVLHGYEMQVSEELKMHVLTEWVKTDIALYEQLILAGEVLELPTSPEGEETWEQVWATFDVFAGLDLLWRIRFNEKAFSRFKDFPGDKKERVIERLIDLAQGRLDMGHSSTLVAAGPMRHMTVFSTQMSKEDFLVLSLELNKIPIVQNNQLKGFAFHHFLRIVDITNSADKVQSSYKQYLNLIRDDPATQIHPSASSGSSEKIASFENSVEALGSNRFGPKVIPNEMLSKAESARYVFDQELKRWSLGGLRRRERLEEIQLTKANANVISELADSASCKLLIVFLQSKVKSFPFQLSEEELGVIGTPGNVLAIGRSGTGKTTCAMLKLLACQALFRWRLRQQERASGDFFGLHIVFITASPTLTIEVKRFYESLVGKLSKKSTAQSRTVVPSEDDETELNEKDLNIKPSMRLMTHKDFPMFSTTRLLVLAIDASLRNPYFQVTEDGGSTAVQAGFHNELKGVRVISHNLKREELDDNYDFQTQSFQLYAEKREDRPVEEEKSLLKKEKRLGEHVGFEVDFDYFHRHFWPTVRVKGSLSSSLIWSEIAGKLKGSAASSTFVNGYVPKEMYMTQNKKSSLLTAAEKESVWATFMQYERWKEEEGAYDFQDVVTHALKEIDLYGYEGAPVHFMMVDEVQDLTHATLLLLAKITEQNMFFSGDTAQTIAKGVSFRFSDLNSLFASHEGLKLQPPVIKQLLVNYRSHNRVLNLANCVVRLIELLFPKTIDKLDRESSIYEGESLTPIVLMNPGLDDIVNALVVGETVVRGTVTFGSGQVVLVPDESARQRLPEILKGALCLTIYESKGLEFDDVILFEFFENCGVEESEWRMLRELLYEERSDTPADIYSPTWKPRFLLRFESAKHAALCTALKMLYVAITRTKRKFIVYDSSPSSKPLLDYMISIGIVTCKVAEESGLPTNISEVIQSEAGKVLWHNLGIKMMKLKFYSQAAKCFGYAADEKLCKKATSLSKADEAARILQAAEAILSDSRSDIISKQQAEVNRTSAIATFFEVAEAFLELGQKRYAAQCYFSARKFVKAAHLYKELKAWNELGDCLFEAREYRDAGKSYLRAKNLSSALRAFDKGQLWQDCIQTLAQIKRNLSLKERVILIRKYSQLAIDISTADMSASSPQEKPKATAPDTSSSVPLVSGITFSRPRVNVSMAVVDLSMKDKKSLIGWYATEDQVLKVNIDTLTEVEKCSPQDCSYSYLSTDNQQWRPSGQRIVPSPIYAFASDDLIQQIVEIARFFESDAQELQRKMDATQLFTCCIQYLRSEQEVLQAIRIFTIFGLRKLAFILANNIGNCDLVIEYLESLAVQVSSVHFFKANQRFGQQFEKYGKYWSGIAALKLHQCLEMIDSNLLLQITESEDTMYPGLVMLGYWKKVVSLTMNPKLASAFGDFQHVKLNYLQDRELPKAMMKDSSTWPGHSTDPMECEVLLCILEETIAQANRYWQVTLNCSQIPSYKITFHKAFPRNQALWGYLSRSTPPDRLEYFILGMFSKMKSSVLDQGIQRDEFALADLFSFFTQLMFSYQLKPAKEFIDLLGFEWFEDIMLSCKLWLRVFDPNSSSKSYMRGFYSMLRASLAPFGVRVLSGDFMVTGLPIYTHLLVSSDCVFFSELVQRSVKMYPVDIEGNIFLAPISEVLTYLRLTLVKFLTEMVTNRKLHYQKNKEASTFFFRQQELLKEQMRAKTAACIFGEISHLRTIQRMFPEEYRFVGRAVGDQLQIETMNEIVQLRIEISELSGEEYAYDDPAFATHLRRRNAEKIRNLEKRKKELVERNRQLLSEETRESDLSDFLASLPIAVHTEMIWLYEHKIVLPKIAKMHLMAYITEKMKTFNPRSDIPKLRYLDNLARICGCQPYLKSLIEESSLSTLLFPEEEYAAGNFMAVIQRHLAMIYYPNTTQVALRQGLDIKEKFLLIQKCILWSLILTRHKLILPKLFALQITRYYGDGLKWLQKKILEVHTNISICNSLHLLCDMILALRTEDQCESISHTVLLLTASVIVNTSWLHPFFAFSEVIRRLFYCIKHSPLRDCNQDLVTIAKLPVQRLGDLAFRFRRSRYLVPSIKEIAAELNLLPPEEEQTIFLRDTHSTEDEGLMLVKLTDEELQEGEAPATVTEKKAWYEGRDLELVVQNEYLEPGLSEKQRDLHRRRTAEASKIWEGMDQGHLLEESLSFDPFETINSVADQLLLCDFQRKMVHFDVFREWKSHFNEEFGAVHTCSDALLAQIDLYHTQSQSGKQRSVVYSNLKLLVKISLKLNHFLSRAVISCKRRHKEEETESAEMSEEEEAVKDCGKELERVIRYVKRTDLRGTMQVFEEESQWLQKLQAESGSKWKITKK